MPWTLLDGRIVFVFRQRGSPLRVPVVRAGVKAKWSEPMEISGQLDGVLLDVDSNGHELFESLGRLRATERRWEREG
jgi:hypothetical protein